MDRFSNRSDRELWEFHVPVEASAGLKGSQIRSMQDGLIEWIETNASRFPVTLLYDRYANPHLGETIAGIPFPVSLHRGSLDSHHSPPKSPLCGQFMMKYFVDRDLERARTERLERHAETNFEAGGLEAGWCDDRPCPRRE